MKYPLALWKFFLFCLALSGFFIHVAFLRLIRRQKRKQRIIKKYCQLALRSLNVKLTFKGEPPNKQENFLIVCNHLSYLDILILYSFLENPCFIVAKDILETKFLGSIPRHAEAYGVERKKLNKLKEDIEAIKNILLSGRNVILFPEGATGDGKSLKPFKSPFFNAAVLAKKKVFPLCINYILIDGKPFNEKNKNKILWRGQPLIKHFFRFCQSQKVEGEIVFTTPLPSSDINRLELSLNSFNRIACVFKPVPFPTSGNPEK